LELIRVEVQSEAGLSIEAAAALRRYAALAAQLQPRECLLTAHHRQDQAETLLLQALRGAGVRACRPSGLPSFRVRWHARPVLDVPHGELLKLGRQLENFKVIDP